MAEMIRPEDIRRIISDSDRRRPGVERDPEPLTRRTAVDGPILDEASEHGQPNQPDEVGYGEAQMPDPVARQPAADPGATAWIDPPATQPRDETPLPGTPDRDSQIHIEQPDERAPRRAMADDDSHRGYDGPPLGRPSLDDPQLDETLDETEEAVPAYAFDEEEPRRRRPWLLALVGLLGVGAVAAGVILYGAPGQQATPGVEAPVLKAQVDVDKVKPSAPGGLQVPNRDVQVLDPGATRSEPQAVVLQPPPEEPAPLPPVPQVQTAEPEVAPEAATAAGEDQIAAIIEQSEAEGSLQGTAATSDRLAAPGLAIPPRPSAKLDGREDSVAAALAGTTTAAASSTQSAEPAQANAPSTSETAAQTPPPSTTSQASHAGSYLVQLASLTSSDAAARSWQTMSKNHAAQLSGLSHSVQRIEIEGRGTFYRLRAGPFPDRAAAESRCKALKDKGQACIVIAP